MRQLAIAFAAVLVATSAFAADMATKAPIAPAGYPYAASGFYFGVGASAEAQSASTANTGIFAAGAGLDGIVGYQWQGGLQFIAAEFDATYTNLGASGFCGTTLTACSTTDQFKLEPLVKFGFPVTALTAILPNLSQFFPALPQLPAGVTATNVFPYLYAGVPIEDVSASYGLATGREWTVRAEVGAGMLNQWQQGLAIDTRAGCSLGSAGFSFGPANIGTKLNTECTTRLSILY